MKALLVTAILTFGSLIASANCNGTNASRKETDACLSANAYRAQQGLSALILNSKLNSVARAHAKDMSDRGYFEHDSPEGATPSDRLNRAGVEWESNAENIAMGQNSGQEAVNSWIGSPGHHANLVNAEHTKHGMGEFNGHWVHVFVK